MSHFYGDQYGYQRYAGDEDTVIDRFSPASFGNDGGYTITVWGDFLTNGVYSAFLGSSQSSADTPCYSGVSGNGYNIICDDGQSITFVTPAIEKGTQYITISGPGVTGSFLVTVIEKDWFSKNHRMRRSLAPWVATGSRTLSLERRI